MRFSHILVSAIIFNVLTLNNALAAETTATEADEFKAAYAQAKSLSNALLQKLDANGADFNVTWSAKTVLGFLERYHETEAFMIISDNPQLERYRPDFVSIRNAYRSVAPKEKALILAEQSLNQERLLAAKKKYQERLKADPAFRESEEKRLKDEQLAAQMATQAKTEQDERNEEAHRKRDIDKSRSELEDKNRKEEVILKWLGTPITEQDAKLSALLNFTYEVSVIANHLTEGPPHQRITQSEFSKQMAERKAAVTGKTTIVYLAFMCAQGHMPDDDTLGHKTLFQLKQPKKQGVNRPADSVENTRYYGMNNEGGACLLLRSDNVITHSTGAQTLDVIEMDLKHIDIEFLSSESDAVWTAEEMLAAAASQSPNFIAVFKLQSKISWDQRNRFQLTESKLLQPVKLFPRPFSSSPLEISMPTETKK